MKMYPPIPVQTVAYLRGHHQRLVLAQQAARGTPVRSHTRGGGQRVQEGIHVGCRTESAATGQSKGAGSSLPKRQGTKLGRRMA